MATAMHKVTNAPRRKALESTDVNENPVHEGDTLPSVHNAGPQTRMTRREMLRKTATVAGAALIAGASLNCGHQQENKPVAVSVQTHSIVERHLVRMENALKAFVQQDKVQGFYDYKGKRPNDEELVTFDPNNVQVPADSWARDKTNGFLGFVGAVKELYDIVGSDDTSRAGRQVVFNRVTKMLKDNPYLKYQAFYDAPDGKHVYEMKDGMLTLAEKPRDGIVKPPEKGKLLEIQNNIFIQNMSRQLMTLAMYSFPSVSVENEKRQLSESLFQDTVNGKAAAKLFNRTGLILAGFGLPGDTDKERYKKVNVHPGWKAVDGVPGGRHGGGIFDFAYFTTDYLNSIAKLHDQYPNHLILGDREKPVTLITAHGYRFIYEMDDFAYKYAPEHAGTRNILGYLYMQDLNTFSSRTTDFTDDVEKIKLNRSFDGASAVEVKSHTQVETYFHELLHKCNARIADKRPDLQERLLRVVDLGVKQQVSIMDIEGKSEDFSFSGKPAYQFFKERPVEAGATLANVAYVDAGTVLEWCSSAAGEGKTQPLNHILWLLDVNSLDPQFRETDKTFLFTLQPNGYEPRRVDYNLKRDKQGRIQEVSWEKGNLQLEYSPDTGFASLKNAQFRQ
jgi:hypothetical protein